MMVSISYFISLRLLEKEIRIHENDRKATLQGYVMSESSARRLIPVFLSELCPIRFHNAV